MTYSLHFFYTVFENCCVFHIAHVHSEKVNSYMWLVAFVLDGGALT